MNKQPDILKRILRMPPGWVGTPADFADLGTPQCVGMVLLRLVRRGKLRRLARGLYDLPRQDPVLGKLLPTAEAVIDAVRRRDRIRIEPHEAMAANLLQLTEQVQGRLIFITDGAARRFKVGPATFELRHRSSRKMGAADEMTSMVIAALRALGRAGVTVEQINHLRGLLPPEHRSALLKDLAQAPAWMRPVLREIGREENDA